MAQIEHRDITGVLLHFSQEQIIELLTAMPPEQRRFARVLAETIQKPHEIWQVMREDEAVKGQWRWVRSYVQYLDLSDADTNAPFGVSVTQFAFHSRWELETVGLVLGNQGSVMARIDEEVRRGSCEYSAHQH